MTQRRLGRFKLPPFQGDRTRNRAVPCLRGASRFHRGAAANLCDGRRREAGQSLVEFALILPVLLLLIVGTIEFGGLMASYVMVESASREAARYAATVGDTGLGTIRRYADCAGIREAALRVSSPFQEVSTVVIQYDNGPGTASLVPAGCPPPADQIRPGTRVMVRVRATRFPIVPLILNGPIELVAETHRTILADIEVSP